MPKICRNKEGLISNLDQGSKEWLDLRKGKITGTRAHTVLVNGIGVASLIDDLVVELLSDSDEESYKSRDMVRGNELEIVAKEEFAIAELDYREVFDVGVVKHKTIQDFMISPDGLFETYGLMEVKCFADENFFKHLKEFKANPKGFKFLEEKYNTQVQAGLSCSGNDFAKGVIFNPNFKDLGYIEFDIERNDKLIKELEEKVEAVLYQRDCLLRKFK